MKYYTCLAVVLSVLLVGCSTFRTSNTKDDDSEIIIPSTIIMPPTTELTVSSAFDFSSTKTFSDKKIHLKGNDNNGITHIDITDPNNFDIRDLSAFTIALYRSAIQNKLKSGETLSDLEISLLKFIWQTQNEALEAFSLKGFTSITGNPVSNKETFGLQTDKKIDNSGLFQTLTDDCVKKAVETFFTNNNLLANRIDTWAQAFHSLSQETRQGDINRILEGNHRRIDSIQWRQYIAVPVASSVPLPWSIKGPLILYYVAGFKGLGENKELREYKNYTINKHSASSQWKTLFKSLSYYVSDYNVLYDDTMTYLSKTTDSHSKRQLEDFHLRMLEDCNKTISKFRTIYCDYPFATACCKAYICVQSRKGVFNDDEEAMKQDANDFAIYVSGMEMLKNLSSHYSAALYVDLLKLLKSELSSEWQSLLTTHKLYEYDGITFADSIFKENSLKSSY